MDKQEIQKLIKQQEQRDQEFLVRGEKRAELMCADKNGSFHLVN